MSHLRYNRRIEPGNGDPGKTRHPPEHEASLPTLSDHGARDSGGETGARGEPGSSAIGPYHLLRRLGEGGMGEVWLAEQREPIERTVALKLLKLGMDSGQFVARFESERQALALMDHPSIARVIDAGATDRGRPYFVMEHVDGEPLTTYCDRRRLTIRERLELFVQVCLGVQHAHQKGIIHRDLKPSNVLVTEVDGKPLPKVIDFGLAKATTQPLTDREVHTMLGGWMGTPAYMSPEQAEITGDIDTRSDVYSLGVMLYQLLAGLRPFGQMTLHGAGFDEVRRVIREVRPPRPSARAASSSATAASHARACRTEPADLVRRLRGDLDWIVMKALEKDRELRYSSAGELAADVTRHLGSRPVIAGPPSRVYRARKFVRRHRVGVLVAAALVVTLSLGAAIATWQAVRATRAEGRLRARQAQAEDLIGFMVGDLRTKLEEVGRLEVLGDVGAKALDYFAAVDKSELSEAELLRRSQVLTQIGDVSIKIGGLEAARVPLQEALAVAEDLVARRPDDGDRLVGLGAAHFWLGNVHWLRGDRVAAEHSFLGYLDAAERLIALGPEKPEWRLELAYAHNSLGTLMGIGLPPAIAGPHFRRGVDIIAGLVAEDPSNTLLRRELANSRSWLAEAMIAQGQLEQALAEYRANLEGIGELVRLDQGNLDLRFRLGIAHGQVGKLERWLSRPDAAEREHRTSLGLQEALAAGDPSNTEYQREIANQHLALARLALDDRRPAAALEECALAEAVQRRITALDPSNAVAANGLASILTEMAEARLASGAPARALALADEAIEVLGALAAAEPEQEGPVIALGAALLVRGAAVEANGDGEAAREIRREALGRLRTVATGSSDPQRLEPLLCAHLALGQTGDARPLVAALRRIGYRPRRLVRLCAEHGLDLR